jgi:uncharacterized membrane protein
VPHRLALGLTIGALLWTGIILTAPMTVHRPALAGPAAAVYAGAAGICHQRPERSFHVGGRQLPVCARCFGLYIAGAAGALLAWGSRVRPGERTRIVLALAAAPTVLTWTAEVMGLATFSNATRALAALPLGVVAGWVFVQMLRYDSQLNGHQVNDGRPRVHGG